MANRQTTKPPAPDWLFDNIAGASEKARLAAAGMFVALVLLFWVVPESNAGRMIALNLQRQVFVTKPMQEYKGHYWFESPGAHRDGAGHSFSVLVRSKGDDMQGADLVGAYLRGVHLQEADLRGANLGEADLRYREKVTLMQLAQACGDVKTKLPDHLADSKMEPCYSQSLKRSEESD